MKVIFLDFDGVLVTYASLAAYERAKDKSLTGLEYKKTRYQQLSKACVAQLNRVVDATGAVICVSSTWRLHDDYVDVLRKAGVTGIVIGCTERLFKENPGSSIVSCQPRGVEIAEWLSRYPDVTHYVIVDDDSDMADLLPALVHTSMQDGLTQAHADEMIRRLTQPCVA